MLPIVWKMCLISILGALKRCYCKDICCRSLVCIYFCINKCWHHVSCSCYNVVFTCWHYVDIVCWQLCVYLAPVKKQFIQTRSYVHVLISCCDQMWFDMMIFVGLRWLGGTIWLVCFQIMPCRAKCGRFVSMFVYRSTSL